MKTGFFITLFIVVLLAIGTGIAALSNREKQAVTLTPEVQQAIQNYIDASAANPSLGTTLPIAGQSYNLAGSGVSNSATSITLASFTVTQTGQKIRDQDLSDTFYVTLEPGNPSKQEIVSCTTVVQNSNGSATLSGCSRGLSPITPYTASSTLRFSHGGGTPVIFSNPPQFYNNFLILDNNATVTGTITFSDSPLLTTECTALSANNEICAKAYIDSTANAGASDANDTTKGIVETATNAELAAGTTLGSTGARLAVSARDATSTPTAAGCPTGCIPTAVAGKIAQAFLDLTASFTWAGSHIFSALATFTSGITTNGANTFNATTTSATSTKTIGFTTSNQLVAGATITLSSNVPMAITIATSSGRVFLADGDVSTTTDFQGFAVTSGTLGGPIFVQRSGVVTGFSGLTAGLRYYVQDTAGTIGTTVGTAEVYVGIAISATELLIDNYGASGSWQYLGSQSITCTASSDTLINQPFARFAILKASVSNAAPNNLAADVILAKVGKTTANINLTVAGGSGSDGIAFTWTSTSSIRAALDGSSCSVTAYYYR